jgi:hypothetical protein
VFKWRGRKEEKKKGKKKEGKKKEEQEPGYNNIDSESRHER